MKRLFGLPQRYFGRAVGVFAIAVVAFVGAYELFGGDEDAESEATTFHDMRVLARSDFTSLVDVSTPAVRELASRLRTPEEAYRFVRDRVGYSPSIPLTPPDETLRAGAGSCLSKAALLASLYRVLGIDAAEVRVVTGQAYWQDQIVEHAWLELEFRGRCLQQDPTTLFGTFEFDSFPGTAYTRRHVRREFFCFNDKGFAVISLNNRFRGQPDPHQAAVLAP